MSNPIPSTYQERDRVRDQRNATGIGQAAEAPLASQAARDVLAERERQKAVEGWTEAHDDSQYTGNIAFAAACYAMAVAYDQASVRAAIWRMWPWDKRWWKPAGERRNLVKAGALILAEIERLDRAALAKLAATKRA